MENQPEVGLVSKQVRTLQDQLEDEYQRLNKLRDRKNEILTKLSELQETAINAKAYRDDKNKLIAEKKILRDKLHTEKTEVAAKITDFMEKRRTILVNAKEPKEQLVQQLKELSWRYQTTTLSMDEDRRIVQSISELEKKLLYFKKTDDIDQEIRRLRAQFKEIKDNANSLHKEIITLADESKNYHETFINAHEQAGPLIEELNGIRAEMTSIWEDIQKSKVQLSDARVKFDIAKNIALQQKAAKLAEQAKLIISRRSELAGRASEKLKKGERLTFEEYGALLEEKGGGEQA